jgi:hypothetical protein
MVANNGFIGTCYTCGEVGHRSSNHIDRGRHQSLHPMRRYGAHGGGNHADSRVMRCGRTVVKEIVTLTIVKVTEVRAQEVHTKEVWSTKQNFMYVAVKEVTSIVSALK